MLRLLKHPYRPSQCSTHYFFSPLYSFPLSTLGQHPPSPFEQRPGSGCTYLPTSLLHSINCASGDRFVTKHPRPYYLLRRYGNNNCVLRCISFLERYCLRTDVCFSVASPPYTAILCTFSPLLPFESLTAQVPLLPTMTLVDGAAKQ